MIHDALLSAGLLIIVAKLAEGILRRFRLNAIVAYTAAGILLGPVTGVVDPAGDIGVLLGIGIFLFFFLIGLDELDISGFIGAIRGRFFLAALISAFIPIVAGLVVTFDLGHDFGMGLGFTEALALAGVLSLTSLGVVAKVLIDEDQLRSSVGIQIFTIALIAELLVLLMVGFTIGEHTQDPSWDNVLILLAKIAGFVAVTWVLASRVIPPLVMLLREILRVPQLSFGLILGCLFVAVVGAERIGLHGSLGALLLGAAFSRLPYQLRREIVPGMRSVADGLFVPLFFSSAGLYLSLSFTALPAWTIVALALIPLAGKFAGASIGAFAARLDMPFTVATGQIAKGVAEIALLLVLLESGVIGHDIFSLLVLIMLAYILLGPPVIAFAVNRAKPSELATLPKTLPPSFSRFALDDISVGDVIDRTRSHPGPQLTVRAFAERWIVPHQQDYVVVDKGEYLGIVSLGMLRYLPKHSWSETRLDAIARRTTPKTSTAEPVEDALQRMTENSLTVLPVMDEEAQTFVGAISSQEILELITSEAVGGQ